MISFLTRVKNLFFIFGISLLVYSCGAPKTDSLALVDIVIPENWESKIPDSDNFTGEWWLAFQDSTLEKFILDVRLGNPNLKSIIHKQEVALQTAKLNGASVYPNINLALNKNNSVQNLVNFGFAESFLNNSQNSSNSTDESSTEVSQFEVETYGLNLLLQWEIDIWGRALNGKKAATKDFQAQNYELSYLGFSTIIRSIQTYFEGVEAQGQLNIAEDSYNSLAEIRDMVKNRYEQGIKSSFDLRMSETYLASSKVQIEMRKVQLSNINRILNTLQGRYPSSAFNYLVSIPKIIPEIPKDLPADIINRRPDVRAAIAKLEASDMRVAQSKRNLLPGLLINASGGTSTNDIADILNDDYGIGNLGISFTAPIFNQGRLRSNIKLNKAIKEEAIESLKLKLLTAFMEVEQLLYLDNSYRIQLNALETAKRQALETYNLSKERYDKGLVSLELVLNSQRQYNDSRSQFLVLKRQKLNNYLSLILALGGNMEKIDKN